MEPKKRGSKKVNSSKSKRTAKKRPSLFKTKQIKPKVKLDSNKVLWLCVIIVISCVLLLVATIFLPESAVKSVPETDTAIEKPENNNIKRPEQKKESQSEKKESRNDSGKNQQSEEDKKRLAEKKLEEQRRKDEEAMRLAEKQVEEKRLAEEKKKQEEKARLEEQKKQQQKEQLSSFNFPKAVNNAQIVFLLDDGGQSLAQAEKFISLPMPLTIAVLPKLAHSKEVAAKIRSSGKELMLHQPMQALNGAVNPGPGAIKPEMTENEIISTLFQNIEEIGPVAGMNNHEGSAITADAQKMEVILKYASENGIFFLDSRTNKDTQVPYVSKALGYSYYERNGFFLDNVKTRENALSEIRKNIDKANKEGVVIMIGHVWSADWLPQLLMDIYPELKAKGYVVTTVSKCKGKK